MNVACVAVAASRCAARTHMITRPHQTRRSGPKSKCCVYNLRSNVVVKLSCFLKLQTRRRGTKCSTRLTGRLLLKGRFACCLQGVGFLFFKRREKINQWKIFVFQDFLPSFTASLFPSFIPYFSFLIRSFLFHFLLPSLHLTILRSQMQ